MLFIVIVLPRQNTAKIPPIKYEWNFCSGGKSLCRIGEVLIAIKTLPTSICRAAKLAANASEVVLTKIPPIKYEWNFCSGGDSRGRTGDLLNAIQALYQLSYTPSSSHRRFAGENVFHFRHALRRAPPLRKKSLHSKSFLRYFSILNAVF